MPNFFPSRSITHTVGLVLFCAGALWACDDGGKGIDSGVMGTKELSELSSSEAKKICDAAQEYSAGALSERVYERHACVLIGLAEGEVVACRETQAACEGGRLDGGSDFVGAPLSGLMREEATCLTTSALSGCDATVAELESCYEALIGQRVRELYEPRCESLAVSGRPIADGPAEPPVCRTLQSKCSLPSLLSNVQIVIDPPDRDSGQVDPPDPPDPVITPGCEDLALSFDDTDCASEGCGTTVDCDCDPFTQSFSTCNQVRGCLAAVDCEAACQVGLSTVYSCAGELDCVSDADCGSYYCVDDGFGGECSRGEPGDSCEDSGDCASGACATLSGISSCAGTAAVGAPCETDSECASGICYVDFSVSSIDGLCSSGDGGEACNSDDECVDGSCVTGADASECSDGTEGAPCSDDFDCDSSLCAYGGRAYATCGDAEYESPCDSSSDCTSGNCETSATTGESTCGYAVGDACDGGFIDCSAECRPSQGDCGTGLCVPSCGGGSCGSETLAAWSMADVTGSLVVSGTDDLTASTSGNGDQARATIGATSGTYYWEVTVDALPIYELGGVGVTSAAATLGATLASSTVPGVVFSPSGMISNSAGDSVDGCGYMTGDVIGVALDLDAEVIYFSVNGLWQAGGSPDDAEGGIDLDLTGETVHPALELWTSDAYTANFGQSTFAFPPPDGFDPLF